jgi:hypothetical protein
VAKLTIANGLVIEFTGGESEAHSLLDPATARWVQHREVGKSRA